MNKLKSKDSCLSNFQYSLSVLVSDVIAFITSNCIDSQEEIVDQMLLLDELQEMKSENAL